MSLSTSIYYPPLPSISQSTQSQYSLPLPPSSTTYLTRSKSSWIESLRSQNRSNQFQNAVSTFIQMQSSGVQPDIFAFPAVLKAVTAFQDLNLGKQIHGSIIKFGYDSLSVTVANTLLHMYGTCGDDIHQVLKLFARIPQKDQVSWNSAINALCKHEEWELAIEAFRVMQLEEKIKPSSFTLVSLLLACSNLSRSQGLRIGKQVHGYSLRVDDRKTFTDNALMAMYSKLGRIDDAKAIFEWFTKRDMVSWNTIISSLSQNDRFYEALECFSFMIVLGFKPDGVTISSVLPACSHLELLDVGREIHNYVLRNNDFTGNSFVASALVDMYCNCKQVVYGRRVFDNVVADRKLGLWNAMLAGYTQNGLYKEALMLFMKMVVVSGLFPNPTTMASVLPACVHCRAFADKEVMHGYVIKLGLGKDRYVQNALVDLYSRTGKINNSKHIFSTMDGKDIVSWNTMITGYVVCGHYEDALILLREMAERKYEEQDDLDDNMMTFFKPNSITLMTALPSCAALAALSRGKEIHAYAIRNVLESDVAVGSALVDMYAKCGCLNLARRVFESMPTRNVITWNVIIMAYGMHGKGNEALVLFRRMVAAGSSYGAVKPNEITFIAIFAACSHSGMVDEGKKLFQEMKEGHALEPNEDHYACIVDLLGRAGNLEEAYQIINRMPPEYDKVGAWSSLLGACRIHQNIRLGEISAKNLLELEPKVASHYVLLSNIYSSSGLWDKATEVRKNMKEMRVKKEPGCSWIELGDGIYKFLAGDVSHPQSKQLYFFLDNLFARMKKEGYVPDTSSVLHNVDEEEKENLLCGHSERLAMAFGLLNAPPGTTIRIAKNLRVCNDCHTATKFISKIVDREIIVRDVRRFHHFKGGTCSCGDYW